MITLHKVDGGNIDPLLALEVDAHQRAFVASNTRSILDAYVAITAGGNHTVGLRADGTMVATGSGINGQCNVEKLHK